MNIVAIPAPTEESEKRKHELQAKAKQQALSSQEESELFGLEMRQFWNCEC